MPDIRMRNDGAGVSTVQGAGSDGATQYVQAPNQNDINAAIILWVRDEINALRTLGLIGLTARSVADCKNGVSGKLPT